MKILLDTHIAIWAVLDSEELPDEARAMILDEDNEIYYSAASVWEITIKHMAHPETFLYSGKYLAEGCSATYPPHKDPFDRILLAQAKSEGMKFMTHDGLIPYYNESFIVSV